MKIIDLLVKISKGEEVPKKIKYDDDIYIHVDNYCYFCEETNEILSQNIYAEFSRLNDEVEIIEEEKEIEFEDIKELGNNFTFENTNSELEVRDFEKSIISKKINSLIKNQKKIIDVINDTRDK